MPILVVPFRKGPGGTIPVLLLLLVLLVAAFTLSLWFDTLELPIETPSNKTNIILRNNPTTTEYPVICTTKNQSQTCPENYPKENLQAQDHQQTPELCPDYFRWIHEDLKPWKDTGITRDMVERAKPTAHFRLVILEGKVYIETFKKSIQTRDKFTIWGILQLLRRYPGKLRDLELMFDCDDRPVVPEKYYKVGPNRTAPPPLFRYCSDRWSLDMVFPDWSFWGWAEINIKPWHLLLKDLKEGNSKINWTDREPYAYWKGNPFVVDTRKDLLTCNVSHEQDWNARLFIQDWILESQQGFKQSDVSKQCTHRYKIYIEGYAWSVSEKYILACDSVTLLVKPNFHDFFIRSLEPLKHYWPIRAEDKCKSIKHAVDWGNKNKEEARAIGKAAADFIQKELRMEHVYDYIFHLLNEYAELLKFKPQIPEGAAQLCSEIMACPADGPDRKFMFESLVKSPFSSTPCAMPSPYESEVLQAFYRKNLNAIRRVEKWEDAYWENLSKQQQQQQLQNQK